MMIGASIFAVFASFLASFPIVKDVGKPDEPSLHDEMKALCLENAVTLEQLDIVIKTLAQMQTVEG